jgi:ubiquinol-cytochrome c reductase cytochrome c subunit
MRRVRRTAMVLAASVCGAIALTGFESSGQARAVAAIGRATVTRGHLLFLSDCATCHGSNAQGLSGRAPSLRGVGALAADFYLETGRMPLATPGTQPQRGKPAYSQRDIRALIAYVGSFGGPPIPIVDPALGNTAVGERLFAVDCAGCHSIQAQGGIITGATVPSLAQATARQIGEAVRLGPYVMPRFSSGQLTASETDSIARYVGTTQHPDDAGGWGIGRLGPIPEGMVAWLFAIVALLLVARLLGERSTP